MFEKIFKPALAAAALSVAGCADKPKDNIGADRPEAASVMKEAENGNIEITIGEEVLVGSEESSTPTPGQVAHSDGLDEPDGMTREEIDKLQSPE